MIQLKALQTHTI